MSEPFFTISIPTKNRPERVGNAVKSVLEQTNGDVEVIVCDNSDEAFAAETREIAEGFGDPRVRYLRTSGRLSMPDNWERSIEDASGQYVGILTDRSVLRRDALEVVGREIEATDAKLVTWFNDLYGKGPTAKEFKRRECTLRRYRHDSQSLIDYFVHGNPKYSNKVIPKLMTSVCHRSVLDEIRASPIGRVCPPVAPDFTSGFLMLAHCDWVLAIDEALYVSCGTGNGGDFRRGGELAKRFKRDLGMEEREIVDRMPSDACFSHALVLNDLMRVRDAIHERLPGVEVDRPQYYLGCLNDFVKAAHHGARRDVDLQALLRALKNEPPETRKLVKATSLYERATSKDGTTKRLKTKLGAAVLPSPRDFDTVFDAMAWDAANPREPAPDSFISLRYGIDELFRQRQNWRGRLGAPVRSVIERVSPKLTASRSR